MAITPVENSGNNYFPASQNGTVSKVGSADKSAIGDPVNKPCQTWKNRTYKDRSSDPSVSFQTPTHLSPEQAALAVVQHENEHVVHNRQKAERNGEMAFSTVTVSHSVWPECGRIYVSGGETKTTTVRTDKPTATQEPGKGGTIDITVW